MSDGNVRDLLSRGRSKAVVYRSKPRTQRGLEQQIHVTFVSATFDFLVLSVDCLSSRSQNASRTYVEMWYPKGLYGP